MKAQWSVSFGPGIAIYSGDVAGPTFSDIRPAGNMELWYKLSPSFYLKAGASIYRIFAKDIIPSRNRTFRSDHLELYSGFVYTPFPAKRLMPFASAGIGITSVNPAFRVPTDELGGHWWWISRRLGPDGSSIPSFGMIFPIGGGLRYVINSRMAFIVDGALRFTNTDMLDGVGTAQVVVANLSQTGINYFEAVRPNGINSEILQNGNPNLKDVYGVVTFKLQINLGGSTTKATSFKSKSGNKRGSACPTYK
ncbi:MAG: hypothetical protein AAGI07_03610 [Bacteroidota bacterium]